LVCEMLNYMINKREIAIILDLDEYNSTKDSYMLEVINDKEDN